MSYYSTWGLGGGGSVPKSKSSSNYYSYGAPKPKPKPKPRQVYDPVASKSPASGKPRYSPESSAPPPSDSQSNVPSNATGTSGSGSYWAEYYKKRVLDASGQQAKTKPADRYSPWNLFSKSTGVFAMDNPVNRGLWNAWKGATYDPTRQGGFGRNSPFSNPFLNKNSGGFEYGRGMGAKSDYFLQEQADAVFRNQWRTGIDPNQNSRWRELENRILDPEHVLYFENEFLPRGDPNPYWNPYEETGGGGGYGGGGYGGGYGGGGYGGYSPYDSYSPSSPYSSWYKQLINWRI